MDNKVSDKFYQDILREIHTLDRMIESNAFVNTTPYIGAEQELCLVNKYGQVANLNQKIITALADDKIKTELGQFNLEINLEPQILTGEVLSNMELDIIDYLDRINHVANEYDGKTYLGGILPTLRYLDLSIDNITPDRRYYELVQSIAKQRGKDYELRIQGEDELHMRHDSVFLEAATTSFQIHLEVPPHQFALMYNIAQMIAAPLLAISANSSVLFQKKLWHESRIALLRQAINVSKTPINTRSSHSRVSFGQRWVNESILELFREDVSKHKPLIFPQKESPNRNDHSKDDHLRSLQNFNSTIYRWNRPVYGYADGTPHLRIENRILPSGPTVADQMANAALWYGLMYGLYDQKVNPRLVMDFNTARNNFTVAARNSMYAIFDWYDGHSYTAYDLIMHKLLPIAAHGLGFLNIDPTDIDFYLNLISERCKAQTNGAIWMNKSVQSLTKAQVAEPDIYGSIVTFSHEMQAQNIPIHQWEVIHQNMNMKKQAHEIVIEEYMERDIYTVQSHDLIQLAADMVDWQKIRYIIVENEDKQLVGLVSSRTMLRALNKHHFHQEEMPKYISEIMIVNPWTVDSSATLSVAVDLMRKYRIGCLPVLQNDKLVGIITEQSFLNAFDNILTTN